MKIFHEEMYSLILEYEGKLRKTSRIKSSFDFRTRYGCFFRIYFFQLDSSRKFSYWEVSHLRLQLVRFGSKGPRKAEKVQVFVEKIKKRLYSIFNSKISERD